MTSSPPYSKHSIFSHVLNLHRIHGISAHLVIPISKIPQRMHFNQRLLLVKIENAVHAELAPAVRAVVKTVLSRQSLPFYWKQCISERKRRCYRSTLSKLKTPSKSFVVKLTQITLLHYQYSFDVFLHLIRNY